MAFTPPLRSYALGMRGLGWEVLGKKVAEGICAFDAAIPPLQGRDQNFGGAGSRDQIGFRINGEFSLRLIETPAGPQIKKPTVERTADRNGAKHRFKVAPGQGSAPMRAAVPDSVEAAFHVKDGHLLPLLVDHTGLPGL